MRLCIFCYCFILSQPVLSQVNKSDLLAFQNLGLTNLRYQAKFDGPLQYHFLSGSGNLSSIDEDYENMSMIESFSKQLVGESLPLDQKFLITTSYIEGVSAYCYETDLDTFDRGSNLKVNGTLVLCLRAEELPQYNVDLMWVQGSDVIIPNKEVVLSEYLQHMLISKYPSREKGLFADSDVFIKKENKSPFHDVYENSFVKIRISTVHEKTLLNFWHSNSNCNAVSKEEVFHFNSFVNEDLLFKWEYKSLVHSEFINLIVWCEDESVDAKLHMIEIVGQGLADFASNSNLISAVKNMINPDLYPVSSYDAIVGSLYNSEAMNFLYPINYQVISNSSDRVILKGSDNHRQIEISLSYQYQSETELNNAQSETFKALKNGGVYLPYKAIYLSDGSPLANLLISTNDEDGCIFIVNGSERRKGFSVKLNFTDPKFVESITKTLIPSLH